jgi:hypothetical protein
MYGLEWSVSVVNKAELAYIPPLSNEAKLSQSINIAVKAIFNKLNMAKFFRLLYRGQHSVVLTSFKIDKPPSRGKYNLLELLKPNKELKKLHDDAKIEPLLVRLKNYINCVDVYYEINKDTCLIWGTIRSIL